MAEEQTIQKVDKLGFFEIKNFCPLNDIVKEMKRQTTDWKKIFAKYHISLINGLYKEL